MDIVEKEVNNKIISILNNYFNKDDFTKIAKTKIEENKKNNTFGNDIKEYETKISKISLDIDSIYDDKLSGVISEEDFIRIYTRKKQEKENLQKKVKQIQSNIENNIVNEDEILKKIITKFKNLKQINREMLCDLVDKIEVDKNKQIYIYFKFKSL